MSEPSCPPSSGQCWPSALSRSMTVTSYSRSNGMASACWPSSTPRGTAQESARNNTTVRYPEFDFLVRLPSGTILDGEMVVLRHGQPDFALVQSRDKTRSSLKIRTLSQAEPATFMAFDLLYENYSSLLAFPLLERRQRLERLLGRLNHPRLTFSLGIVGRGQALFTEVCCQNLEGIMGKRLSSRYRPGQRSRDWIKIKPPSPLPLPPAISDGLLHRPREAVSASPSSNYQRVPLQGTCSSNSFCRGSLLIDRSWRTAPVQPRAQARGVFLSIQRLPHRLLRRLVSAERQHARLLGSRQRCVRGDARKGGGLEVCEQKWFPGTGRYRWTLPQPSLRDRSLGDPGQEADICPLSVRRRYSAPRP